MHEGDDRPRRSRISRSASSSHLRLRLEEVRATASCERSCSACDHGLQLWHPAASFVGEKSIENTIQENVRVPKDPDSTMIDHLPESKTMDNGSLIQALMVQARKHLFKRSRKEPIERSFLRKWAGRDPRTVLAVSSVVRGLGGMHALASLLLTLAGSPSHIEPALSPPMVRWLDTAPLCRRYGLHPPTHVMLHDGVHATSGLGTACDDKQCATCSTLP